MVGLILGLTTVVLGFWCALKAYVEGDNISFLGGMLVLSIGLLTFFYSLSDKSRVTLEECVIQEFESTECKLLKEELMEKYKDK